MKNIIEILRSNKEDPFIGVFVHKYDPDQHQQLNPNLQEFLRTFKGIGSWSRYSIFLSSIYDNSLHLAFMRTISRAIPINLIQKIIESAIFFETKNQVWRIISDQMGQNYDQHEYQEKIIKLTIPYGEKIANEIVSDWLTKNPKNYSIRTANDILKVEILEIQKGILINVKITRDDNFLVTLTVIEGLLIGLGNFFGFSNIERLDTNQTMDESYISWKLTEF